MATATKLLTQQETTLLAKYIDQAIELATEATNSKTGYSKTCVVQLLKFVAKRTIPFGKLAERIPYEHFRFGVSKYQKYHCLPMLNKPTNDHVRRARHYALKCGILHSSKTLDEYALNLPLLISFIIDYYSDPDWVNDSTIQDDLVLLADLREGLLEAMGVDLAQTFAQWRSLMSHSSKQVVELSAKARDAVEARTPDNEKQSVGVLYSFLDHYINSDAFGFEMRLATTDRTAKGDAMTKRLLKYLVGLGVRPREHLKKLMSRWHLIGGMALDKFGHPLKVDPAIFSLVFVYINREALFSALEKLLEEGEDEAPCEIITDTRVLELRRRGKTIV